MENVKYGKEVQIRRKYRRFGWIRTYRQRVRRTSNQEWSAVSNDRNATDEERRWDVSEGLRRSFGLNSRRRRSLVWRTRRPGRFRHESRRIQIHLNAIGRRRRRGSWKWFESTVEVNWIDRRTSFWRRFPYRWWRRRKEVKPNEDRPLRRWVGARGFGRSASNREGRSDRRSRRRSLGGYRRCTERWLRRFERQSGRKWKERERGKEENDKKSKE